MIPYLDMHCDTLTDWLRSGRQRDLRVLPDQMVDLERLHRCGALCQFFAVFFRARTPGTHWPSDEVIFDTSRRLLLEAAERNGDIFAVAHNYEEILRSHAAGKVSGVLTFEDSRALDGKMENLYRFYEAGVRCMGLVWNAGSVNASNCLGSPNTPDKTHEGLTAFGREAVREMQRIGVLVDVSHLSDQGFWDVIDCTDKPFVASHSSCRAVCDRLRNLTDGQIRALADHGGVSGVNFCPDFVVSKEAAECSAAQIAEHALHFIKTGGEDCVAIGTDFDGIEGRPEINEPTKMYLLYDLLKEKGVTERQLDKLFSGNALRVIRESMK